MKIQFSPPDITQEEIDEVVDTLKSGWITTGPKTKLFEKQLAEYCNTPKAVCLNSATKSGYVCVKRFQSFSNFEVYNSFLERVFKYLARLSCESQVRYSFSLLHLPLFPYAPIKKTKEFIKLSGANPSSHLREILYCSLRKKEICR